MAKFVRRRKFCRFFPRLVLPLCPNHSPYTFSHPVDGVAVVSLTCLRRCASNCSASPLDLVLTPHQDSPHSREQ